MVLRAGTDNRANEALVLRASTTKWPLTLVNMQMAEHLLRNNLLLDLRWRPRDENTLADDLTNKAFGNFDVDGPLGLHGTITPRQQLHTCFVSVACHLSCLC